jgi:hypothetical protein
VRPGTLITTSWEEIDAIDPARLIWQVPAARMKLRLHYKGDEARDHLVPLPAQSIEMLKALRALTGRGSFLFPNQRHAHKPARENALGYLLNRAGAQKSVGAHTIGGSWPMLARICVTNDSCDGMKRDLGNGWARQLEGTARSGTPNAGICTSIRRHLNFKRPDVRSGGASRRLGEKGRSASAQRSSATHKSREFRLS